MVNETGTGALGGIDWSKFQQPPVQPAQRCPHCGYCPHCGRSNPQFTPYVQPGTPTYPWVTWSMVY